MLLSELISQIPGVEATGNLDAPVRGISYDSRSVEQNYLFVAMKGAKTDGNRYAQQAIERGAIGVASEEVIHTPSTVASLRVVEARMFLAQAAQVFFQNPAAQLKLVGITGTNGKTTTSYLVDAMFRHCGLKTCLAGTIGMKIGDRPSPSLHTTPEAPDLLNFLRQAVTEGCTHGALEVSSHSLVMKRVFGTRFVIGVFTNLTPEHLDFHQDMESYYQAKRLLFLPAGGNQVDLAVINTDDPWGRRLAAETPCPVLCYGLSTRARVRTLEFHNHVDGTDLRISTPKGEIRLHTRLIGRPNMYNILAAVASGLGLGFELEEIQSGIAALQGVPGRMELIDCGQPFTVLVDYAHTPDALQNALETLAQLPHGKIITVFGCGGDRDKTKRPAMGEIASSMSDYVFATSDNPRTESPAGILEEIEPGLRKGKAKYHLLVNRQEAIAAAICRAGEGDVVLIAGKGHEDYQILGTRTIPFDDRVVARDVLMQSSNARGS